MRKPESARYMRRHMHVFSKLQVKVAQYRVSPTPCAASALANKSRLYNTTHRKRPLKIHLVPRQLANHIMPYPRNFWRSIRAYPLLFLMGYHNRLS